MDALDMARFAPGLPLLVSVFRRNKLSILQKWLVGVVVLGVLTEIGALWMGRAFNNNLPLYHIFVWVECSLLVTIFKMSYQGLLSQNQYKWMLGAFGLIVFGNMIFFQGILEYPTHTRTIESILVIVLALRYFFLVMKELKVKMLEKTAAFWFATAVLLYFSTNLLPFIYSNYIVTEDDVVFFDVWTIHSTLLMILYLMYSIALLCKE